MIGRIYTNRADTDYYKCMLDELQWLTEVLTGKPLWFKRLTPGGNLLAMNTDMEVAQVLGVAQSFLPTNNPAHSGIPSTVSAEEIV
jgi:hypothetical protein